MEPDGPPRDAGTYDAIIVGGGLSGLTAAYYLKDRPILLLEKESRVGGKMRREQLGNRLYPVGGIYLGEPEGEIQKLFKELRLKVEKVTIPDHSMALGLAAGGTSPTNTQPENGQPERAGNAQPEQTPAVIHHWITEGLSRLPYSPAGQARLRKFQEKLYATAKSDALTVPIEDCDPKILERLDRFNFRQWLDNEFGWEAAELGDLYTRDILAIPADQVSAAVGLLHMASETEPSFSWEGGLGAVSEALADALGPRISTGAFVWRVSQALDGATVEFHDGAHNWQARARTVILTVPSLVTRRIVEGLTDQKREALAKVRYSSYALVPLRLKRVIWKDSLVLWTPGRFFADLTLPLPSSELLQGAQEEVLVASLPMGESEGRKTLLEISDAELTARVLADLDTVFKGAASEVVEAHVLRWGHAMPIPYPGYVTQVRPIVAKPEGRIFFAGVDTQLPELEGAIHSGILAARQASRFLKQREARR